MSFLLSFLRNWATSITGTGSSRADLESLNLRKKSAKLEFLDYAQLCYQHEKPYYSNVPFTKAQAANTNVIPETKTLDVYDVRGYQDQLELDVHGFTIADLHLDFVDWEDGVRVVREVYPQITDMLKKQLGDVEILIFDHTLRKSRHRGAAPDNGIANEADAAANNFAPPSRIAHVDQTLEATADQIRLDFKDKADALLQTRYRIINVWKPIAGPVRQHPFVLCDYRTCKLDGVACDLVYPHTVTEIQVFRHSPSQRWYTLEGQTCDEAWLFKIMDSAARDTDGLAEFAAHTSFFDEREELAAEQRCSVEFRSYVFG